MPDFDWSQIQPAEALEESRAYRFKPEWRPILLQYLGITPGMRVLEVGCGPGTFAPYLAAGIGPGSVTGLDLDARFIERAREKARRAGTINIEYIVGDAYALPFPADSFDAVTSYTGIGVLTEPEKAVAEMIRVCRPGGSVSLMEAVTGPSGIRFDGLDTLPGHETYPGADRYRELRAQLLAAAEHLAPPMRLNSRTWPAKSFLGLLAECGLQNLQLNAWGYAHTSDDARHASEERRRQRTVEYELDRRWLESVRTGDDAAVLAQQGFSAADVDELLRLAEARRHWLLENPLYDWEGGVSLAFAGRKPD